MTLDGFCDHTVGIADNELHQHYTDMLRNAGTMIWGRTTYQLMEDYWPAVVKNPSDNPVFNDFAEQADNIHKIVFSRKLKSVAWKNTTLKSELTKEDMTAFKQQDDKDILVGSPGLIAQFTNLGLIDEYRICIHPMIAGKGLVLFKNMAELTDLDLLNTKTFGSGVVVLYYETRKEKRG